MTGPVEISDLIWPLRADGRPGPVRRSATVDDLRGRGQKDAARIVAQMPHSGDLIDPGYLTGLAFRVHAELSRLGEEMQLAARVADTLRPHLARLLSEPAPAARRPAVVDVGCGLGHVLRTIAGRELLDPRVRLIGADLNATLIEQATRLASIENLDVEFVVRDAFTTGWAGLDPTRTIVVSTGLLHHIPATGLPGFFAAHARAGYYGFAHWDIAPSRWAALGSWIFHQARMREPVSRHDGVMSARRAHPSSTLTDAARAADGYQCAVADEPSAAGRLVQVLRPVNGWRP